MREFGKIQLPQHFVKGVGLNRNTCDVSIHTHGEGELGYTNLKCASIKTIDNCRSYYKPGKHRIFGCPLRSNQEQNPELLKKNFGIEWIQK